MVSCDDMLDTESYVDTFEVEFCDKWDKIHLTDSVFYVGPEETQLETTVLNYEFCMLKDIECEGTGYPLSIESLHLAMGCEDHTIESPYLDAAIEGQKVTMIVKENNSGKKIDINLHLQAGPRTTVIEIHQSAK